MFKFINSTHAHQCKLSKKKKTLEFITFRLYLLQRNWTTCVCVQFALRYFPFRHTQCTLDKVNARIMQILI